MWRYLKIIKPVTAAKFINKSSLFVLLPGVIFLPELKLISDQKSEHLFVAPPYFRLLAAALLLKQSLKAIKFHFLLFVFGLITLLYAESRTSITSSFATVWSSKVASFTVIVKSPLLQALQIT
jgi:hypothetical protein